MRTVALPAGSRRVGPGVAVIGRMRIPFLTILLLLALAGPAAADTFAVDRNDDAVVSACSGAPNDCTLRGAITQANLTTDPDTITIPAIRVSLKADLPSVTQPLTITGA